MLKREADALNHSSAPPAVIGWAADGRISRWDERAEQIYGRTAQSMIGMPVVQLAPGNDPTARAWLRAVVSSATGRQDATGLAENGRASPAGLASTLNTRAVRPDLTSAAVSFEAGPPRPRRSSTAGLLVVRQLDQHRPDRDAELDLLRTRVNALRTAITASGSVAIVIDEDGFIRHVANTTTLTSGWSPAQLIGRPPLDFVHPDDRAHAARILDEVGREPGAHAPVTLRGLDRHGQPHWVEGVLVNALDDPDVRAIVATFIDLPEPLPRQNLSRTGPSTSTDDEPQQIAPQTQRDLQRAFDELDAARDFELDYQPVVDLSTGEPVGARAQLQWHHPALGLIGSDAFSAAAEANGTIVDIGRWVLAQACHEAVATGNDPVFVAVSQRQLGLASFVDDVATALDESGLAAERLVLEVSESAVLAQWSTAADTLRQLKRLDVRIALDGFGASCAVLKQLKELPVDIVKIHQALVAAPRSADPDDTDAAILTSVIEVARKLSKHVVADGVDTVERRDLLVSLGCTHAEGRLFEVATRMR